MSGAKIAPNMCNYLVALGSVHTKKVECRNFLSEVFLVAPSQERSELSDHYGVRCVRLWTVTKIIQFSKFQKFQNMY